MHRRMAESTVIAMAVLATVVFSALPALGAPETTSKAAYENLEQRFAALRENKTTPDGKTLVTETDQLEADARSLANGKETDPDSKVKSLELLSRVCDYSGKAPECEQAYADYAQAIKEWRGEETAARVVKRDGERYFGHGDYADAAKRFSRFLSYYPENKSALEVKYQLACCRRRTHEYDAAEKLLREVLEKGDRTDVE